MVGTLGESVVRRSLLSRLNGVKRLGATSRKLAFVSKHAPLRTPMLNQVGAILKRIRTTARSLGPEGAPGPVPGAKLSLSLEQARSMLKAAVQNPASQTKTKREPGTFLERLKDVAAKTYTHPATWTVIGAGTGAGAVMLGTKKKGKQVMLRTPSRAALAAGLAAYSAASNLVETVVDRVTFARAYKARKREGKLWKSER